MQRSEHDCTMKSSHSCDQRTQVFVVHICMVLDDSGSTELGSTPKMRLPSHNLCLNSQSVTKTSKGMKETEKQMIGETFSACGRKKTALGKSHH